MPAEAEADRVMSAVNAKVDRWQKPEIEADRKKGLVVHESPEKEAADNCAMDTPKVKDRQRIERMVFVVLTLCVPFCMVRQPTNGQGDVEVGRRLQKI